MTDSTALHGQPQPIQVRAKSLMDTLESLLTNVYADMDVPREKVRRLIIEGEALAEEREAWVLSRQDPEEFLKGINTLAQKILATLDLKRLREEGLVKAVKL